LDLMLAMLLFVAIAGPSLLIAFYWWRNSDRRVGWRRASEDLDAPDARKPRGMFD
jgi:hypothetical protein